MVHQYGTRNKYQIILTITARYQNFVNMEDVVWLQINKQTLIVEAQVQTIWEYIQINAADLS